MFQSNRQILPRPLHFGSDCLQPCERHCGIDRGEIAGFWYEAVLRPQWRMATGTRRSPVTAGKNGRALSCVAVLLPLWRRRGAFTRCSPLNVAVADNVAKTLPVVFVCGNAFVRSVFATLQRAQPQGVVTRGQVKGARRYKAKCQGTFITPSSEAGCSPLDRVHPENCTLPLYLFIYFYLNRSLISQGSLFKTLSVGSFQP